MSESKRVLYHCERCGELFRAPVAPADQVVCNLCGNAPVKAIQSNLHHSDLKKSERELMKRNEKDQADFLSMKRSKEKLVLYKEKQALAIRSSKKAINQFLRASDVSVRSEFVVNGVELLVPMENYYKANLLFKLNGNLKVRKVKLVEDERASTLRALFEDDRGREMEVVFLEQGDDWKIDWEHFVRYNEVSWSQFLLGQKEGSSGEFRLYVRQRTNQKNDNSVMRLIFYEARVFDGERGDYSPEVELNRHTEVGNLIAEALVKADEEDEDRILGSFDDPGLARVNVELEWVKEGGDMKVVVKNLKATDWMIPRE